MKKFVCLVILAIVFISPTTFAKSQTVYIYNNTGGSWVFYVYDVQDVSIWAPPPPVAKTEHALIDGGVATLTIDDYNDQLSYSACYWPGFLENACLPLIHEGGQYGANFASPQTSQNATSENLSFLMRNFNVLINVMV